MPLNQHLVTDDDGNQLQIIDRGDLGIEFETTGPVRISAEQAFGVAAWLRDVLSEREP